jgi:hypothetical protein
MTPPRRLTRQVAKPHKKLVDSAGSLTTLANRPHHQALSTANIASRKHFRHIGGVAADEVGAGLGVAAVVFLDAERFQN